MYLYTVAVVFPFKILQMHLHILGQVSYLKSTRFDHCLKIFNTVRLIAKKLLTEPLLF